MKEIDSTAKMQVVTYSELSDKDVALIDKAKEAMKGAYAPYSNFCVGAAVSCGENIVIGSNQENEAFPSGMCAERVALYSASAQYPTQRIEAIAISAYNLVKNEEAVAFPCGACRQVLSEYEKRQNSPIRIIVASKEEVYIIEGAKTLLPFSFNM